MEECLGTTEYDNSLEEMAVAAKRKEKGRERKKVGFCAKTGTRSHVAYRYSLTTGIHIALMSSMFKRTSTVSCSLKGFGMEGD